MLPIFADRYSTMFAGRWVHLRRCANGDDRRLKEARALQRVARDPACCCRHRSGAAFPDGTRTVAPRCCHCVPVRRAAPGETLACIGGAYAVAPGRALAVAMGCYRLGVLAGIRRSRLAALAYGGLLYYPTPRQSLSHKGAAFIYTRIASELGCQDREVQAGSVSIDTDHWLLSPTGPSWHRSGTLLLGRSQCCLMALARC